MSKINLTFKGKTYAIAKSLLESAISSLEGILGKLENNTDGETLNITDENVTLIIEENEAGGQTAIIG